MTPGSIIRSLGPWGPGLVSKYARNRFQQGMHLTEQVKPGLELDPLLGKHGGQPAAMLCCLLAGRDAGAVRGPGWSWCMACPS